MTAFCFLAVLAPMKQRRATPGVGTVISGSRLPTQVRLREPVTQWLRTEPLLCYSGAGPRPVPRTCERHLDLA